VPPLSDGRLAVVLHSHMPYVEGYGTWPFGEEWLWEAMASCYLPLLEVLGDGAPLTLSLTPVLCDQLEAPGVPERFRSFIAEMRRTTHALDAEGSRSSGRADLAAEIERAAGDYERALAAYDAIGGDLLGALAPHVAWTSSATHAVLPLLATTAGIRLQLLTGIDSHRARFGEWGGGFWLPECAHAPWLDGLLEEAGVHATCVDLTDVFGRGDARHLRPLRTAAGPLLVPIDRETVELVWHDDGYPAGGAYRDYHHHTTHHHKPWAIDGSVYDRERALAQARADAQDFVARVRERVAGGGLCVCALDTELLGHWWYEGVDWLRFVVEEAGDLLVHLDEALGDPDPAPAPAGLPVTTWGTPRDLSTWSGPEVADVAFAAREAELRVLARGRGVGKRALRELLAVQASDWAFLASREAAGPYARDRHRGHLEALEAALADGGDEPVRNLVPHISHAPLLAP
jgi:1,4-alpha-glucan branching enzyme